MYKTVFQNSKAALVFAGMTIFGAVSMVGTSEKGGVLDQTVERLSAGNTDDRIKAAGIASAGPSSAVPGNTVSEPESGWGSSSPTIFGEYATAGPNGGSTPVSEGQPASERSSAKPVVTGVWVKPIQD